MLPPELGTRQVHFWARIYSHERFNVTSSRNKTSIEWRLLCDNYNAAIVRAVNIYVAQFSVLRSDHQNCIIESSIAVFGFNHEQLNCKYHPKSHHVALIDNFVLRPISHSMIARKWRADSIIRSTVRLWHFSFSTSRQSTTFLPSSDIGRCNER